MGLVAPFAFAITVVLFFIRFVLSFRVYFSGNWLGNNGWIIGSPMIAFMAIVSFCLTCYMLLRLNRYTYLILLSLIGIGPLWLVGQKHSLEPRFRVELLGYQRAVQSGQRYGDQFSEVVDGRKLIYWRWVAWGFDNAYGVIYDPEDRFLGNRDVAPGQDDGRAFRSETGGYPNKVTRMEPRLYIVEHS